MWLEILQIIIPAVLIVGGGSVAYWRFMQEQESTKRQDESDYRLKADNAAWQRVNCVITELKADNTELKSENRQLAKENQYLRELLDEG